MPRIGQRVRVDIPSWDKATIIGQHLLPDYWVVLPDGLSPPDGLMAVPESNITPLED